MTRGAIERARAEIRVRLGARRPELEQAILARVYAISNPAGTLDPTYIDGLRITLSAALDYGLAAIESDAERPTQIPTLLLAQARLAARSGVSLDTVLRRYFAGYSLLSDFLIEETEKTGLLSAVELKGLLRAQAALFDGLLAAVSEEYRREERVGPHTSEQRLAERVQRLLDGELVDLSGLSYHFDGFHLGLIAQGPGARRAVRQLASTLDCLLLLVQHGENTVRAWLGSRRELDSEEVATYLNSSWPADIYLAVGHPEAGLTGWRLSHRQAAATLPIALRGPKRQVRYADVAILASILQDDLLIASLRQLYLAPLGQGRDGGDTARETLRAYFASDRNVSSAAAALGVKRHTVTNRLRTIEEDIGRPLESCAPDLEAALRLEEIPPVFPISGYR